MKKHLSVFGFFARSSFFKVLLILLAMCAVEFTFFHFELKDALEAYEVVGSGMPSLERMFMRAATNVYFRVALALITVVICLPGCEFKSNTSYIYGEQKKPFRTPKEAAMKLFYSEKTLLLSKALTV